MVRDFFNLSRVKFTEYADVIDRGKTQGKTIFNPQSSHVKTLGGDDLIIGTGSVKGDFGFEVVVGVGAKNFDSLIASVEFSERASLVANGIINKGIINTNEGGDVVSGSATANLSATAATVSQAIAIAETADTSVITKVFGSVQIKAIAEGLNNSGGGINTDQGNDTVEGKTQGSVAAVATAHADASAIVEAIATAPMCKELTAFAGAIAQSLAQAKIVARGINNQKGKLTTGPGADTISATAYSSAATLSETATSALVRTSEANQALAQAVAEAFAQAEDAAIAIDNTGGLISMENTIYSLVQTEDAAIAIDKTRGSLKEAGEQDRIEAIAKASGKAIAIQNIQGVIRTGYGDDTIIAKATGSGSCGIFGGDILTGAGRDTVRASSFGGGVKIYMGTGNDYVEGFGEAMIDGGEGYDTLSFGSYNYHKSDFKLSLGANKGDVMFELDGITMQTRGFEKFTFSFASGVESYSYGDLPDALMGVSEVVQADIEYGVLIN